MKRFSYYVGLPLALLAVWLLLNESLSPGHIVLGAILASLLGWAASALRPLRGNPKRPLTILVLMAHVAVDIVKSNFAVARIVCLGKRSHYTSAFLDIPLRMTDAHGLAMLACIVTYTPGTVWTRYSEEDSMLTLHVLDLKDEAAWLAVIQERYERPLMEIFE
jgi:multicomponent K+:H+ antiporter subunit E